MDENLNLAARRILVVDDCADTTDLMKLVLEERGYQVEVAYDGPTALETARTFRPHICLLDVGLPVMDGYELARRLRERAARDLHLVAITGYGQYSDRLRSAAAGFDLHLVKPLDLGQLERVVEYLRP